MAQKDIYTGQWSVVFGPDSDSSFTTMNALVINTDGSLNIVTAPGTFSNENLAQVGGVAIATPELIGRVPTSEPDGLNVTGSGTVATNILFSQDTTGFQSLSFQFTAIGSSATVILEGSNDNATFNGVLYQQDNSTGVLSGGTAFTPQTSVNYHAVIGTRYIRIRLVANSSGTVTANAYLRKGYLNLIPSSISVTGNVASGATDSGNPAKVGGVYNSTPPTFTNGQRGDIQISSKGEVRNLLTCVAQAGGDAVANSSGGVATKGGTDSTSAFQQIWNYSFNGTTWDRQYSNVDTAALITLTAQAAGTVNSADQTNFNARGVQIIFDMTVATTTSVVINIQGKDAASGKYYTILSSAAIATVSTNQLTVYPGTTAAANLIANQPIPRVWRVQAVVTGGSSAATATIGASVIL